MKGKKEKNVERVGTEHVATVKPTEIRRKFQSSTKTAPKTKK